jgi:nitrogen fixation protein FixH
LQTQRPYETGLKFNHSIKSAQIQQEQHWQVSSRYERLPDGRVNLSLSLRDNQGKAVDDVQSKVTLVSPVTAANDVRFDLVSQGAGDFGGTAKVDAGQWDLVIEIVKDKQEVFRSVSRISLR